VTDVSQLFIQLRLRDDSLDEGGVKAIPTGQSIDSHDVFVGVDAHERRHLLVPIGDQSIRADDRSHGVRLGATELQMSGETVRFLDLECRAPKLDLVFERLVDDVLGRLDESVTNPPLVVAQTLDQWRDLLRSAGSALDRDSVVGLHGELEVLSRLGKDRPEVALETWVGPTGRSHDFVTGQSAIEVKTTSSVDGNTIQVSNLDQLDPALHAHLHLTVVHLRETPNAPSLDDRMRALIELGFPSSDLISAVEEAGYVFESGDSTVPRLETRNIRVWEVQENFPGLRSSDLGERRRLGVSRVRYELALDVAPPPLGKDAAAQFLGKWVR
jgi:hypothetical protein